MIFLFGRGVPNETKGMINLYEIQQNIDEITCIFQKVLFSLVKNMCYFTCEKYSTFG